MADITLSNIDNFLRQSTAPMQVNFRKQHVLHAELQRKKARNIYEGNKVAVPVLLNSMQGGGNPGQSGTINQPHVLQSAKAEATLQNVVQPFSITLDADEDSSGDNSAWAVLAGSIKEARNSLAEIENDQFNAATALLASVASATGSPGLTVPTTTTSTQYDRLYPGRVVDLLTKTTGANPGNGLRRKINTVNESTGDIVFDTASQASDGSSGNITFAATTGIYVAGVYDTGTNNALAGLNDIASASGTFQNIARASVAGWQAIDGRGGVTTTAMLADPIMDGAVRRGRKTGGFAWDFALGAPNVIDGYKQTKYALVRYDPEKGTLKSGFKGIVYDGADKPIPLIKEDRFEPAKLVLVPLEDIALYAPSKFQSGPSFVNDDGSMFRRTTRTLPKEAWLRDRCQLVAFRCNRVVFVNNLDVAV